MDAKKIQTVLGPISPNDVGVTMTHEHLTLDIEDIFFVPPKQQGMENLPFTLENFGWISRFPNSHRENLRLANENDAMLQEVHEYKKNGGCTIVECTNSMGRDIKFMTKVSKETGVNIVAGAGYYVWQSHPADMSTVKEEVLVERILRELTEGCDKTDVKAGMIGEIGCSWPLAANEKKSLRASAQAQIQTGCPVIVHPGRDEEAPFEIVRILQEAGGDIKKTVMSHLDRTIFDCDKLTEFASLGPYCEYDLFGLENSHYQFNLKVDMPSDAQRISYVKHLVDQGYEDKIVIAQDLHFKHRMEDMPSDAQRIDTIKYLISQGFEDKLLMSHDIHTIHRLKKYGGHGLSHVLLNIVPKMKDRGITQEVINKILIHNPKQWLQF